MGTTLDCSTKIQALIPVLAPRTIIIYTINLCSITQLAQSISRQLWETLMISVPEAPRWVILRNSKLIGNLREQEKTNDAELSLSSLKKTLKRRMPLALIKRGNEDAGVDRE